MKAILKKDLGGNLVVDVRNSNNELVLYQPFNPETLSFFSSTEEAVNWVKNNYVLFIGDETELEIVDEDGNLLDKIDLAGESTTEEEENG